MLRLARLACLLAAFAFAGPLFAQNITDATPTAAAVGTTLTINGSGFGTAKPKVQLFDTTTSKKYSLKVVTFSDTQITASITKAVEGDLQLQVIVKGAAAPANAPTNISIEAPLVTNLSTPQASPDGEFTIFGDFFGIKKGKISIGGQNAKVVTWAMNEIHVRMPKKLFNGFFTIAVDNKLGVDNGATIEMINSSVKIGKATLNLAIDGSPLKLKITPAGAGGGVLVIAGVSATSPSKNVSLVVPFNPATDVGQDITTGANLLFTYTETGKFNFPNLPPVATWVASGIGVGFPKVHINAASGGQVSGTVDSILPLQLNTFGSAKPATVHLTGEFIVDLATP